VELPKDSPLGDLRLDEVLDEYDGPKLFTAKNASGAYYRALWVMDEAEAQSSWLYVPISKRKIETLKSGAIPIRSVYQNASDGWVFRLVVGDNGVVLSFTEITSQNIGLQAFVWVAVMG
jgi:hypothetical protein